MSEKESLDRAVKDDHLNLLVSFDRCDGFVELRNRSGPKMLSGGRLIVTRQY